MADFRCNKIFLYTTVGHRSGRICSSRVWLKSYASETVQAADGMVQTVGIRLGLELHGLDNAGVYVPTHVQNSKWYAGFVFAIQYSSKSGLDDVHIAALAVVQVEKNFGTGL